MRKLVTLAGLACGLITVALWWSVLVHTHSEQETLLANWNRTQLTLVKAAANLAASSLAGQIPSGTSSLGEVEQKFSGILEQFQPVKRSTAWLFAQGKIIYSSQADFPPQFQGLDVANLFNQQKEQGAAADVNFVQGVLNSGEGTGWFTWQIEKGPEAAAWTSLQVDQKPLTLVFFTPESEILVESSLPESGQREMVGAGLLTVLLWGIFILAWRLPWQDGAHSNRLGKGSTRPGEPGIIFTSQVLKPGNRSQQLSPSSPGGENFLAHLNHELWTPLNTITGLAFAMQSQIYGPLNEKQGRSLETIRITSQHLTGVIRNILDYSLIQAGNFTIELKPIDADLLIDTCLAALGPAALDKQIQLEIKRDPAVKIITADEKRLGQVFENLLSNAIKFTPPGGKAGLQVVGDGENNQVKFTIWDTGIGIAESDISRIFTPYVQLDAGLDRQQSGLGLGLALAAKIISFHGGSLGMESQPGGGTRFQLTLPWSADNGKPGGGLAAGLRRLNKPVGVLLIDDDLAESQKLQNFLAEAGYEVTQVSKNEEVERAIYELGPALVLLNLPLWGIDSLQMVRSIRAVAGMAKPAVVILAAVQVTGDRDSYLQAGASEYLVKPIRLDQLATALNGLPEITASLME